MTDRTASMRVRALAAVFETIQKQGGDTSLTRIEVENPELDRETIQHAADTLVNRGLIRWKIGFEEYAPVPGSPETLPTPEAAE